MKCLLFIFTATAALAQNFTQRGFLETRFTGFPQSSANDSSHAIGEGVFRWDMSVKTRPWLTFSGGIQAQTDSHHQTERKFHLDVQDRGLQRPAFTVRSFEITLQKDHFTANIGKQFIRWGKADVLNPTDRFAPRDYLSVVDNEFLGVVASRVTIQGGGTSLDMVWTPRFTPSRTPLLNQRWTVPPPDLPARLENAATEFPGGGQYGARLNHIGRGFEASASVFEGYNHLPLIAGIVVSEPPVVYVQRFYPKIRMYGTDSAISLPWFTIKTEAGWFRSRAGRIDQPQPDNYVLYVAQLERQAGEWTFVGGYAGQTITRRRTIADFAPDRGLTRAFLGRAAYNIDARRSFAAEFAVRQNGNGTWVRAEYSHLLGSHWRATVEVVAIGGDRMDFLGQYRRNSHAALKLRYSF